MKQLDALRIVMSKPWYKPEIYLDTWKERSGERLAILTPDDVIGWGFTWEKAIFDADRRYRARLAAEKILRQGGER